MTDKIPDNKVDQPKIDPVRYEPPRVAARMEGVVKNIGIKPIKKKPKK